MLPLVNQLGSGPPVALAQAMLQLLHPAHVLEPCSEGLLSLPSR
jgi:hypothetical protein